MSCLEDCWGSVLVSCCCEKPVAETGDSSGTQSKPLEAATEQQLVETITDREH
jgi:hypothetical protein